MESIFVYKYYDVFTTATWNLLNANHCCIWVFVKCFEFENCVANTKMLSTEIYVSNIYMEWTRKKKTESNQTENIPMKSNHMCGKNKKT